VIVVLDGDSLFEDALRLRRHVESVVLRPNIMTIERRFLVLEATGRRFYLLIEAGRLKIRIRTPSIRQWAQQMIAIAPRPKRFKTGIFKHQLDSGPCEKVPEARDSVTGQVH
jgi:hypothetical protein